MTKPAKTKTSSVKAVRPAYVAADFSGGCKCFPPALLNGKEPILLPYQSRWVLDNSRLKCGEKSRQIGWTWSESYKIDRDKSQQDARLDHWISSRDEIQARLFLEDCKSFAKLLNIGANDLGQQVIDEKGNTAYILAFANGLRAHSMSSNADAQAGKRGGRTLDEFALHPDPRKLYSIAYPGITWGGCLSLFSTHRGTANFFNELINEIKHKGNPKKFSLHTVTLEKALQDGFLYKLQKKLPLEDERQAMDEAQYFDFIKAGCADEESFQQEYCCIPGDDASAFLSYDLIAGCEYRPDEKWETDLEDCKGKLYVGVDVGRTNDRTTIFVMEKLGDVLYTRKLLVLHKETFTAQEHALYSILALPQVQRCCIDRTGIGMQFAERAGEKFGKYKVEGVHFSGPVKEELAYPVRAAFEDRSLRIPSDNHLRADLRAIKKETTKADNIRFSADRSKTGHSDRFWGLALALHAGKTVQEIGALVG